MSMSWLMVSNAADDMSNPTSTDGTVERLLSAAVYTLSNTCNSAVSVEWPLRDAD